MNRLTDMTIGTQLSTVIAAIATYLAHLIENGSILNPNWGFMVYVLLVIAMFFMLLPYLLVDHEVRTLSDEIVDDMMLTAKAMVRIENCESCEYEHCPTQLPVRERDPEVW